MDEGRETSGMREILRLADKLDIAEPLAPVRAELAKVAMVDQRVAEAVKVGRDAATRAVAALVAGDVPNPADLAAAITLSPSAQPDGPYPPALAGIKMRARSAVHQTAWALGLGLADALHARMVELAKGAVAVAGKAELPTMATDENLLFRDPLTATAYAKVTQAYAVFLDAHRMGDALRRVQWLDPLGDVPGGWVMFRHPHRRLTAWQVTPGELGQHGAPPVVLLTGEQTDTVMPTAARREFAPPLFFWHAVRVGAQPGLYPVADAGRRYLAYMDGRTSDMDMARLRSRIGGN